MFKEDATFDKKVTVTGTLKAGNSELAANMALGLSTEPPEQQRPDRACSHGDSQYTCASGKCCNDAPDDVAADAAPCQFQHQPRADRTAGGIDAGEPVPVDEVFERIRIGGNRLAPRKRRRHPVPR